MFKVRSLALLVGIFSGEFATATCPMLDIMEYQGRIYSLARYTSPPSSSKVDDWMRGLPSCSASGQGRASYRVEGEQVFLVEFFGCGTKLSASEAYGTSESRVFASWLSGKMDVALGSCNGGWDPAKEAFVLEQGKLVEFQKTR